MSSQDPEQNAPNNRGNDADLIAELRRSLSPDSATSESAKDEDGNVARRPAAAEHDDGTRAPPSRPTSRMAQGLADQILEVGETPKQQGGNFADDAELSRGELCLVVDGEDVMVSTKGLVLGRLPGPLGIVVADVHVSRRHIRVERQDDLLVVADLGSTNGTRVLRGDEEIEVASTALPLECGDRIVTNNGIPIAGITLARRGSEPS